MLPTLFLIIGSACFLFGVYSYRNQVVHLKFGNRITKSKFPIFFLAVCLLFLFAGPIFPVLGLARPPLGSTRTPPALSPALSQLPASSASLIASAQAGPVSLVR